MGLLMNWLFYLLYHYIVAFKYRVYFAYKTFFKYSTIVILYSEVANYYDSYKNSILKNVLSNYFSTCR